MKNNTGFIATARKAKNAATKAYDTANDYITNARLARFIASHAPEALRVGKYSLRTSARNLAKWGPWAKTVAKLDSGPAIALTEGLPLMHQGLKRQQRRQIASMEAAKGDKNAVWTGAPDFPGDLSIPYQISKNFSGKGYAYGGMVSKKRLFRGVRRKAK